MLRPLILVFALTGMVQAEGASDISIRFDKIKAGSSVTYLVPDGARRTHHFEGPRDDGFEVSYWNGQGKGLDGGLYATAMFNATGQMTRFAVAGGLTFTYTPHNCMRVVGTCRYSVRRSDGRSREVESEITVTDDGFTFERFILVGGAKTLDLQGAVSLDEMGMMRELDIIKAGSTNMQPMSQVSADYR